MATQIWNPTTAARTGHQHPEYANAKHTHTGIELSHEHDPQIIVQQTAPSNPVKGMLWISATI